MPPKKDDDSIRLPGKLAVTIIGILLSGAITFNAWAVTAVYARPTKEAVRKMIEVESPYVPDKNMLLSTLEDIRDELRELKKLIRENHGANH